MSRRRGVGNLHRREVPGRQRRRAVAEVLPIGKIQAGKGGMTGMVEAGGYCEERSRGDGSDGWECVSLGEAAGGEAGPPAADGRREEAGRSHGGQERGYKCTQSSTRLCRFGMCCCDANESEQRYFLLCCVRDTSKRVMGLVMSFGVHVFLRT